MNEIKHLFCLNFLTLSFLLCFDCAISPFLGSGRGVPKKRYWGYSGVFWGAGAKFPIRPSWLINRLSHWLLRPQVDLTNSPGTDSYIYTHSSLITRGKRQVKDSRRSGTSQSCAREFEQFCPLVLRCPEPREMSTLDKYFWGYGYAWD